MIVQMGHDPIHFISIYLAFENVQKAHVLSGPYLITDFITDKIILPLLYVP